MFAHVGEGDLGGAIDGRRQHSPMNPPIDAEVKPLEIVGAARQVSIAPYPKQRFEKQKKSDGRVDKNPKSESFAGVGRRHAPMIAPRSPRPDLDQAARGGATGSDCWQMPEC